VELYATAFDTQYVAFILRRALTMRYLEADVQNTIQPMDRAEYIAAFVPQVSSLRELESILEAAMLPIEAEEAMRHLV
jgi:hypothetical protein